MVDVFTVASAARTLGARTMGGMATPSPSTKSRGWASMNSMMWLMAACLARLPICRVKMPAGGGVGVVLHKLY